MALSRYIYSVKKTDLNGKEFVGTSNVSRSIYFAVEQQQINYSVHVLEEGERLDTLSGQFYKDSSYWWVLAAASGIGWSLQVPPGTIIKVPTSVSELFGVIS